jgi:plastocyanin
MMRAMIWRSQGSIPAVLLIVLSGCGGPDKNAAERRTPKTFTVEISGVKFIPDTLSVHQGDTVVWINKDMVAHDVTQVPNNSWSSSVLTTRNVWKLAVQESTGYYCSIHVVMVGRLLVIP